MKLNSKYFLLAFIALLCFGSYVRAQISVTPAMTYTENFDGYNGNSAATLPAGWTIGGNYTQFRGQGNGTSNSGGSWAYGIGTDRSLGYLGSGNSPSITYTVSFVNNTGSTITSLNISYAYEQWRYAGGNTLGWTVTGTGALSTVNLGGLNTNSALTGVNGVVSTTPKSISLTGLNIAAGAAFGIRWSCSDGAGSDNGNAIDNFQMVLPCAPSAPSTINPILCAGASYTWNGNTYTTPQNLTHTFTNVGGCDSVVTLNLGFYPQITYNFSDTVCYGQSYPWGSQTPSTTGNYNQVFTAGNGCDSTVTLHLYVRPQITHIANDTICAGANYPWGAQTPNTTGTYTQAFPALSGCDSTVTLHLFMRPQITHNFADTICFGESYLWAAQTLTATGNYNQVFTAGNGCDSTVTLHLFQRPVITHSFADTVCFGQSYTWGGLTPNTTSTFSQVFTAGNGCDSTVTLNLYVRPQITHAFADTICFGQSYTWGGLTPNTTGTFSQVFTAGNGCDSTVTLSLFVRPQITHTFADTICFGQSYTWGTQTHNTTGAFTQVFTAGNGCDSTVTLNLFVRPQITHTFADTICAGQSYTFGTQTLNTTGIFTQVFTAASNCDSTVTLHLWVRPQITHTFADTICFAQSYTWGTQTLSTTGTFNQVFTAGNGCDSTVTLHLFVRPQITHTFADTICFAQSYTWGTQILSTAGTFNQVFTAGNGCDSTVTLYLFVRPQITHTFADTICFAQSYTWGTQTLSTAGTFNQVFTAVSGCDSTVTLHLFARPQITHTFADTICFAQSYTWGIQTLNATGTFNQAFPAVSGCDSTATLHLFVRPQITHTFADTICFAQSYTWGTQTLSTTGTFNQVFTAASGCDSTVTLHLFVRPQIVNSITATICTGLTYTFGPQSLTATGTYTQAFPAATGCDSTVTLNLTVTPALTNTTAATICNGTVYNWGSQVLNATGSYTQIFSSVGGCDSIVTLNLTVSPAITGSIAVAVCNGGTYTFGTQVLNASGTYNHVFTAAQGCDSTVTLVLTVKPAITKTAQAHICAGNSYTFGPQVLTSGGTYNQAFTAADGCDSIVTLTLSVSPVAATQIIDTAACGVVIFKGNSYFSNTVLLDTLDNMYGCDSLRRTINITVYNNTPAQQNSNVAGCGTVVFEGNTYTQSTVLHHTYTSMHGCDSLERTVTITVEHGQSDTTSMELCAGSSYEFHGARYASTGVYTATYVGAQGCDSNFVLILKVNPLPKAIVDIPARNSFCVGDSILLETKGVYEYRWTGAFGEDLGTGAEMRVYLSAYSNQFTTEATDANGCRDTASVMVTAEACCSVWLPNAFSPNGDGLNDVFKPEAKGHPKEYVMYIFDRWGATVFASFNIAEGWDGTIKGKPANVATYYYRISGKCVNGEPLDRKGELTLIK